MAVEVVAGAVVAHGGAWVGVPGGDLYVAQVDAGVSMVVTKVCRRGLRVLPSGSERFPCMACVEVACRRSR